MPQPSFDKLRTVLGVRCTPPANAMHALWIPRTSWSLPAEPADARPSLAVSRSGDLMASSLRWRLRLSFVGGTSGVRGCGGDDHVAGQLEQTATRTNSHRCGADAENDRLPAKEDPGATASAARFVATREESCAARTTEHEGAGALSGRARCSSSRRALSTGRLRTTRCVCS
jgi:hypothetical protein